MIGILLFLFVIIVQRVGELIIAKRNEQKLKEEGGVEVGGEHYFLFIVLHAGFFISLLIETFIQHNELTSQLILWGIFLLTQFFRIWCIQSLEKYWNTKIIIIPNEERVIRGPYKFINHPNYIVVGIELIIISLITQAYVTALLFPLLHIALMFIRIPAENNALRRLNG